MRTKKKKNKQEYLRIKKLKEDSKIKENYRKIDYSDSPIRKKPTYIYHDGSLDFVGALSTVMAIKRAREKGKMFSDPVNKEVKL